MNTWNTSYTLLKRASNSTDEAAWSNFVERYRNFIVYVLQKMDINEAYIDDLTQDILLILWKKIPQYDKERAKFRTWLSYIIRNAALTHIKKEKNRGLREGKYIQDQKMVQGIPVSEPELEKIIEDEWAARISSLAMERARKAFRGKAIPAFELSRQGLDLEEIAQKLGISKASANTLRNRVKNCLIKEIQEIIKESEFE